MYLYELFPRPQHSPHHYNDKKCETYLSVRCEINNGQETSLLSETSFEIDSIYPLFRYPFIRIIRTVEIQEYILCTRIKQT